MNLTKFQSAQLMHKHLTGDFRFRNGSGNYYPRQSFRKMLNVLIDGCYIDKVSGKILPKGKNFCDDNHLKIDLTTLE